MSVNGTWKPLGETKMGVKLCVKRIKPIREKIIDVDKEFGLMTCDIEFDNLSFENKEEKQEWINDILVDYCPFVDNYDEIEQALSDALDKYVKIEGYINRSDYGSKRIDDWRLGILRWRICKN